MLTICWDFFFWSAKPKRKPKNGEKLSAHVTMLAKAKKIRQEVNYCVLVCVQLSVPTWHSAVKNSSHHGETHSTFQESGH